MNEVVQNLSDPALPIAIEANFAEEMAMWGHILPESRLYKDQELVWFSSGKPSFNGVLLTHFEPADQEHIHARISSIIDYFKLCEFSFDWAVGPSTVPTNLATYLVDEGFYFCFETVGLAV